MNRVNDEFQLLTDAITSLSRDDLTDIYARISGIKKKATAMRGFLNTYEIEGGRIAPNVFLKRNKSKVLNLINRKEKPIKSNIVLTCEFYKRNPEGIVYSNGTFRSKIEIITNSTNISNIYDKWSEDIIESFSNYQNAGSGWIFRKILSLEINIDTFTPMSGRSYLPLPKALIPKKAIINMKNKDNKCFKWAVSRALYPSKRDLEKVSSKLKEDSENLDWSGLEFPVKVEDISIFEENNPYGVNVFGYNGEVYPLRISKSENKIINLMLISEGSKNHYCWIRNMSRLVSRQVNNHQHYRFICERCLNSFKSQESLDKHSEYCKNEDAIKMSLPKKGTTLKFKNYNHSMRVPFVIYADFECFTKRLASCQPDPNNSYTEKFQYHKPSGFCYYLKTINDIYEPKMVSYTCKKDEDVGQKFVNSIEKTVRKLYSNIWYKKVKMTTADKENYKNSKYCHICEGELKDDKVLDHCHLTGKYRGAAHKVCNLNYRIPKHIPVIFHNLAGYDAHLFIKNLGVSDGLINCIPNNEEKYISFNKLIKIGEFEKDGKTFEIKREIRFIDSFKFMAAGLDRLVGNLKNENFKNMKWMYDDIELLVRKGVFPYDYFDSEDKLKDECLPPKEEFYSKLNNKHISDSDYEHAQKVWREFEIKNMKEYHDLYLDCDVLLLADVFETFRDVCLKNYKLDPVWYYTAPGLAWDALLKLTKIELELLSDPDMVLMIEKGIRGGVSMITKRYSKANNKYMKDYDPEKESIYLKYLDANNLYGWAMSKPLPVSKFKWMNKQEIKYWQRHPCILEVDLEYPNELHDLHNEYPMAPEDLLGKLIPNLNNKVKYVVHHHILKLYLSLGMKITKIHRGITFIEENWMAEYIKLNTDLRTKADNDFEKDFFKLMNNSVFGKTMENIRNRQDIRLATRKDQLKKLTSKPNFKRRTIFSENLIAVHMGKTHLKFNKPIYVGMSILDISKSLMYDFHYNYIKPKYGNRAELCFTDTDSLLYEIKTDDFYKDIYPDLEAKFDTSAYGNHPIIDKKINKKVIGLMKDETSGKEVTEFVGLRAKLYAYKTDECVEKKCKGVKKSVVKDTISFEDYKDCLFTGKSQMRKMNVLRSEGHQIYAETVNKVALSAEDDKRIVLEDKIHTNAHGYVAFSGGS